jgi:hypothetical protein
MKNSRGSRPRGIKSRSVLGWSLLLSLAALTGDNLACEAAAPKEKTKADPQETQPEIKGLIKFTPLNEWNVSGTYAEACTDPPICGAFFGSPPCSETCRKVMVFQVGRGRYRTTDISGLSAVVVVESPPGQATVSGNRRAWRKCDLYVSDRADSHQVKALESTVGTMISGVGGPPFDRVLAIPLAVGMTKERVIVESPDHLILHLKPAPSKNRFRPPEISNLTEPFPFLGPVQVFQADTLLCSASGEPFSRRGGSALLTIFSWNSEVAHQAAEQKTGGP